MIVPEGGGAGNNRSWNVLKQLTFAAVQKRFSWMTFWRKEGSVEYCHVTVVSSGVGQSIRHVKVVNSVGEYVIVEPLAGARRVTWGTAAPAGGADASRAAVRTPATRAARGIFSVIGRDERSSMPRSGGLETQPGRRLAQWPR